MLPPQEPLSRAHRVLRQAWAAGALHHAHLLSGDIQAAYRVALALAADLNCDQAGPVGGGSLPVACGGCTSCDKIANQTHPDVISVVGEGASGAIAIETVRGISAAMAMPPHEARVRVYIVADATALGGAAANALLKTLEEPPARTIFMLCAPTQQGVMPTIRSRCQHHVIAASSPLAHEATASSDDTALLGELRDVLRDRGLLTIGEFVMRHGGERGSEKAGALALIHALLRLTSQQARLASEAGDAGRTTARRWAACGQQLLAAGRAISAHNAAPTLTIESLLLQMRATGEPYDRFQST